jgi:hypothetical protein
MMESFGFLNLGVGPTSLYTNGSGRIGRDELGGTGDDDGFSIFITTALILTSSSCSSTQYALMKEAKQ